jgi:hypothetical protein
VTLTVTKDPQLAADAPPLEALADPEPEPAAGPKPVAEQEPEPVAQDRPVVETELEEPVLDESSWTVEEEPVDEDADEPADEAMFAFLEDAFTRQEQQPTRRPRRFPRQRDGRHR